MKKFLPLFLFIISSMVASATHIRGGYISIKRIGGAESRTCQITLTVFTDTDCAECVLMGGETDVLDFGDNTSMLVPETPNQNLVPAIPGFGVATFTVNHTYGSNGRYTVSYLEPNRNEGVLNIDNSVGTTFYIESQIDLSVNGASSTPTVSIVPIGEACTGAAFLYNPGSYDVDGDSLSYSLAVPFRDRNAPVQNYRDPNHSDFYLSNYNQANEAGNGAPTFSINPGTGTLTWDSPGKAGEYAVAFVIKEWRKINDVWINIGFVRVDRQVIVEDCGTERPLLEIPQDLCITAGSTLDIPVTGYDYAANDVKIEAFSQIFSTSDASFSTATFQPTDPAAEANLTWNTSIEDVRDQPYQIVFRITNNPPVGVGLSTYEVMNVKIVAPVPVLESVDLVSGKYATLGWNEYACDDCNIQIWRKVDDTDYSHSECETGMPVGLGFSLVSTFAAQDLNGDPITSFTDTNDGNGLAVGAQYCYRLTIARPQPWRGGSAVSNEICMSPITAVAPVITKVSVKKIGSIDGEVDVRWESPFEINQTLFPPPYQYILQRNSGSGFSSVSTKAFETAFTDVGVDTEDGNYSYRVLLFASGFSDPVDTSAVAATTELFSRPNAGSITLNWSADVPWSNQLQDFPMHRIYRGNEGADIGDMILIDSANVTVDGLTYNDTGKLEPGNVLDATKTYCYTVMTRGGYGNAMINAPLVNFSRVSCATSFVVGVEEESMSAVNVFPNPAQHFLKIELRVVGKLYDVFLYDQQGRLRGRQSISETTEIDLRSYANGLYFCVVRDGLKSVKQMRIIKN